MWNKTSTSQSRGFTLVEILAALLLIGLILPAAMKGVSMTTILVSNSAREYEATELAETKLAEILVQQDWQSSAGTGTFDEPFGDYRWTMDVSQWTVAELKQVDLTVLWQQRTQERNVTLSTLVYANQE